MLLFVFVYSSFEKNNIITAAYALQEEIKLYQLQRRTKILRLRKENNYLHLYGH